MRPETVKKIAIGTGIGVAVVLAGVVVYAATKPAALPSKTPSGPTPVPSGVTMSVPLTVPSGGGPGNLGVVALPYGATLLLGAPQGASIGSVNANIPSLVSLQQTGTAASVQATNLFTAGSSVIVTIGWTDASNNAQTSTVQVVPEAVTTQLILQPGTVGNLILPSVGGEMLIVPPAQGNGASVPAITSGNVSGSGVTGTVYPPTTGYPGGAYGLGVSAPGSTTVTVKWTDATGTAQTTTIAVFATAN